MVELFKVHVQKMAKARPKPGAAEAIFVAVKTFEVSQSALQSLAASAGLKPTGEAAHHRATFGPQSTDKQLAVAALEWYGLPGKSNVVLATLPEDVGEGIKLWLEEHAAQGWKVPELPA